jgi:hypothetical protein
MINKLITRIKETTDRGRTGSYDEIRAGIY